MPTPVQCPDCKTHIGYDVVLDGLHILLIGNIPIWEMRGVCPNPMCGRTMYWSVRDRAVELVIRSNRFIEKPT